MRKVFNSYDKKSEDNDIFITAYRVALESYESIDIINACKWWLKNKRTMPVPFDLIEIIKEKPFYVISEKHKEYLKMWDEARKEGELKKFKKEYPDYETYLQKTE